MEKKRKFSAVAVTFGSCADRYVLSGYSPKKSFEEMLDGAKQVPDLSGVELVWGWHLNDDNADEIVEMIKNKGLEISMIIPELWSNSKWWKGSFAAKDKEIRRQARERVKTAMTLAKKTGCNQVSPWFGQDGYDYVFQADYIASWDAIVDGLVECADFLPDVRLAVEYKIKEPRTHNFVSTIGKVLLLINEVNRPNVGVNLDIGHALQAYESMAEDVALLKRFGNKLFHLHLNDNYRMWDDDMMPFSVHTLENLELLYWLEKVGYDRWYSLDVFPYREDGVELATEAIEWLKGLFNLLDKIGMNEIEKVIQLEDPIKALKLLRCALLQQNNLSF